MMTQPERAPRRVPFPIKFRTLEVLRVAPVTPHMVRITLGGQELEGFQTPAADDHVRLIFPAPGERKPLLPTMGPQGPVFPPGTPRPASRDYTPRRYDAATGELDIDFVVHGSGPGTTWATHAKPGDFVGVGGPRSSMIVPSDFDWYLLAGDSTALPAIGRWLEELPASAHAIVFIEVSDASEEQRFNTRARVELTWLHRQGAAAGSSNQLEKAIRELQFPPGDYFVWLAGEANALRPIRDHIYNERGTHKKWVSATGYWKRDTADHHEPHD